VAGNFSKNHLWNIRSIMQCGSHDSLQPPAVGIVLVVSVDCEHETRMEHIVSASATHPTSQVGYIAIHR
jgi:hypothetical protein